jgi:hypothetical protein
MFRRSLIAMVVVGALLVLAAPALAGGWAVITLDALPQDVRAGQPFQVGFVVRQHGRTPTNIDLNGRPLVPIVRATLQGEANTLRFEAHQQGDTGHYAVDITLPAAGAWDWSIEAPTFYVQTIEQGNQSSARFAPLTVLPVPAAAPTAPPPAPAFLGLEPAALRWAGVLLLFAALALALVSQRQRGVWRRGAAGD